MVITAYLNSNILKQETAISIEEEAIKAKKAALNLRKAIDRKVVRAIKNIREAIEKYPEYLEIIKDRGGMIKCIEDNFIQGEIESSAFDFQIELENKDRVVVGVNDFKATEEKEMPIQEIDPMLEKDQVQRLNSLKKKRDNQLVEKCLSELTNAAEKNINIMPFIVEAVRAYCTIGEMTSALEKIYGRFKGN